MPQFAPDIRLIGLRDAKRFDEHAASTLVDIAYVDRIAGPVMDLILESDLGKDAQNAHDREWITGVIEESLAECGETGVEIHFPRVAADQPDDDSPSVWELRSTAGVLATITVTDSDFPWMAGSIETTPAFEPLRNLFIVHPNRESSREARAELEKLGVVLLPAGGFPVREFTLQVEGSQGSFCFVG